MKDLSVFTTENGAASLTLREIPSRRRAYILIRSSEAPEQLLEECASFCKACGAEAIYAAGHPILERYPLHTAILRMSGSRDDLPESDAALFPVQAHTAETWRRIYNEKMASVDNAAYLTAEDAKKAARAGEAYFVHRDGVLLGIGSICGEQLKAIASVLPGQGETVLCALNHAMGGERITLEVASTNKRAIRLYERLGMIATGEAARWYKII